MTAYAFTTPITTSTGFTTNCQNSASTSGVTNASTAFDWASTLTGATGNAGGVAALAIADPINKALALGTLQQARNALGSQVKVEKFVGAFTDAQTSFLDMLTAQKSTLHPMISATGLTTIDLPTKTALVAAYTSIGSALTAEQNRLQTLESTAYSPLASIDVTSAAIGTAFLATTTATTFPAGSKIYLSSLLTPASLSGAAVPALPATPFSDGSSGVTNVYAALATAVTALNTGGSYAKLSLALQGQYLLYSNMIFDSACMELGGYMVSGNTNHGAGAGLAGAIGFAPGVDYSLSVHGDHIAGSTTGTFSDMWILV
jgi:hypothetical protein